MEGKNDKSKYVFVFLSSSLVLTLLNNNNDWLFKSLLKFNVEKRN